MSVRGKTFHLSLAAFAGVIIFGTAVLAGGNLWILRWMYKKTVHDAAAGSVLELGRTLVNELAAHPAARTTKNGSQSWERFSHFAQSLCQTRKGVQYVSVAEQGTVLFQRQIGAGVPDPETPRTPGPRPAEVEVGRALLSDGLNPVPVVTFTARIPNDQGIEREVQIALRRDAVFDEEARPYAVLGAMFRIAMTTILASFSICILLVGITVHREMKRERQKQADEHLKFAGALASGVVHDLRNPLSSLRLDVQMLHKEAAKDAPAQHGRLQSLSERIRKTSDRIDSVLGEFLYVSTPSPARTEPVELNSCVKDCLMLLEPRFETTGVTMRIELADGQLELIANALDVKRALINVLTNAQQASPAGGTVTVKTCRTDNLATVEVSDQGPGIPVADRNRVFEMFVSMRPGGTGLGLALAKDAVERSGGSLSVEDNPGGGAKFRISLPLKPDREPIS